MKAKNHAAEVGIQEMAEVRLKLKIDPNFWGCIALSVIYGQVLKSFYVSNTARVWKGGRGGTKCVISWVGTDEQQQGACQHAFPVADQPYPH